MIDFIYHLTFKLFCNYVFGVKNVKILPDIRNVVIGFISKRYQNL